jgi:hypothetical protein
MRGFIGWTQSLFAGALGIPAEVMRETMAFP